jgi:hypothetical protein
MLTGLDVPAFLRPRDSDLQETRRSALSFLREGGYRDVTHKRGRYSLCIWGIKPPTTPAVTASASELSSWMAWPSLAGSSWGPSGGQRTAVPQICHSASPTRRAVTVRIAPLAAQQRSRGGPASGPVARILRVPDSPTHRLHRGSPLAVTSAAALAAFRTPPAKSPPPSVHWSAHVGGGAGRSRNQSYPRSVSYSGALLSLWLLIGSEEVFERRAEGGPGRKGIGLEGSAPPPVEGVDVARGGARRSGSSQVQRFGDFLDLISEWYQDREHFLLNCFNFQGVVIGGGEPCIGGVPGKTDIAVISSHVDTLENTK